MPQEQYRQMPPSIGIILRSSQEPKEVHHPNRVFHIHNIKSKEQTKVKKKEKMERNVDTEVDKSPRPFPKLVKKRFEVKQHLPREQKDFFSATKIWF